MSDVTEKIFRIAQEKREEEFYQMYSDYFEYFINIVNKVLVKERLSVSKVLFIIMVIPLVKTQIVLIPP